MMARQVQTTDSLELLLDTICNTFGGILFIALLVVILLQLAGDAPQSAVATAPAATALDLATLEHTMHSLHSDLQRLREVRRSQALQLAALAPQELQQLVNDSRAAELRRDELQSKRESAMSALAQSAGELAELRSQIDELQSRLADARERLGDLQQQLQAGRAARQQLLRMPVVTSDDHRGEIGVVLQYGRLYVWHEYDSAGNRMGLNQSDFIVLGEANGEIRVTPNPTAGIEINESETCAREVTARLMRFSTAHCYIAVVVRPDSYGEFEFVRNWLQSAGYKYRLMPTGPGDPIHDRGGDNRHVQ